MRDDGIPLRAILGFATYLILLSLALFLPAGTTAWPAGWLAVGLMLGAVVGSRLLVLRSNPDLLIERARYTRGEGAQGWDRVLVPIVGLIGPLAVLVVAGLDHRFGWTPPIPSAVQAIGLLLVVLGYALTIWAMVVNRFFSAVVRIQTDRGHHVIRHGPYAFVRHPGYLGGVLANIGGPLLLSTLWALVPAAFLTAVLALRTSLEDRTLWEGLPGYRDYGQGVRFRWLPMVW